MSHPTTQLYLQDAYLKETTATVTAIQQKGSQTGIILDQTIFYAQGGGQPADQGIIKGPTGELKVSHVSYNNGQLLHLGELTGEIKIGDQVQLKLDWDLRYQHMQWHTAGHLLDEAVRELYPGAHGIEGEHGIGKKLSVTFNVIFTDEQFIAIQTKINQIINQKEPIYFRLVTKAQIDAEGIQLPFKLPENKPLRLIRIGARAEAPDGGTQLANTSESWPITLTQLDRDPAANHTTIHYQVTKTNEA